MPQPGTPPAPLARLVGRADLAATDGPGLRQLGWDGCWYLLARDLDQDTQDPGR